MYGVPTNLDIGFLIGAELIQVCLGQYQVQFHFHPVGSISVEGRWELVDGKGSQIDCSYDAPSRPPYQLHRLIGQKVVAGDVSAPSSFALQFEAGESLRVFDDSKEYESFTIQPGNIIV